MDPNDETSDSCKRYMEALRNKNVKKQKEIMVEQLKNKIDGYKELTGSGYIALSIVYLEIFIADCIINYQNYKVPSY